MYNSQTIHCLVCTKCMYMYERLEKKRKNTDNLSTRISYESRQFSFCVNCLSFSHCLSLFVRMSKSVVQFVRPHDMHDLLPVVSFKYLLCLYFVLACDDDPT